MSPVEFDKMNRITFAKVNYLVGENLYKSIQPWLRLNRYIHGGEPNYTSLERVRLSIGLKVL